MRLRLTMAHGLLEHVSKECRDMKSVVLTIPSFAFIVATRAALGVGVGLLASTRVPENRRRRIGAALVALGAVTTVPAVMEIVRGRRRLARARRSASGRESALVGATRFARKGNETDTDAIWYGSTGRTLLGLSRLACQPVAHAPVAGVSEGWRGRRDSNPRPPP